MQINFCDTSKFGFSRAIGGILFIFSQDTNFILHWQSIRYKVFILFYDSPYFICRVSSTCLSLL